MPHSMDNEKSFCTFPQSFSLSSSSLKMRHLICLVDQEIVSFLEVVTVLWHMSKRKEKLFTIKQ